ncbi:MAG: hypothetical protein JW832_14610 [Deltaproteobacteria bacterium]|nr:hypothetical protein [Deltaproteobacteria bacterium]
MSAIDSRKVVAAVAGPMAGYRAAMKGDLEDWIPLEHAAQMLLDGTVFDEADFPADFRPIIGMMRLILEKTASGGWNWSDPDVQRAFAEAASGTVYRLYAEVLVAMVVEILKAAPLLTVVEVGSGSGFVTGRLCRALRDNDLGHVRLIATDMMPAIERLGHELRSQYPELFIEHCCWNIQHEAPPELRTSLLESVLVFERFSLPYAGYCSIVNLASIADALLLVDDLSLTGQKASFDHIYSRIGTQFLVLEEAYRHLSNYFSSIHTCDAEVVQAIHSPVSTFTLAVK